MDAEPVETREQARARREGERMQAQFDAVVAKRQAAQDRLDAGGRARAAAFMRRPRCVVCNGPMVRTDGDRHWACDPTSPIGKACVCPPECSDDRYGNGPRDCDPSCVPCRQHRGDLLPPGSRRRK